MYKLLLLILVSIIFTNCDNNKTQLIESFDKLYNHTDLDKLADQLDEASSKYYKLISQKENLNVDKMLEIGLEYNLPYFTTLLLASCGDYLKKTDQPENLFYYLNSKSISFFNTFDVYKVDKERTRAGDPYFVAIYREVAGARKLSWAKFSKEGDAFKYDLIYTLAQEEKLLRKLYSEDKPKSQTHADYLKQVFPRYNNQACDIAKVKDAINEAQ